jgi:midasin
MKKVISFIASNYRNDKIWLRRTLPSKRDYKILLAIDDSLSMKDNNLGLFSLESLVTIMEALNSLEVGKVAVAGIRERLTLF